MTPQGIFAGGSRIEFPAYIDRSRGSIDLSMGAGNLNTATPRWSENMRVSRRFRLLLNPSTDIADSRAVLRRLCVGVAVTVESGCGFDKCHNDGSRVERRAS